jgi:hypothetical protein
MVRFASPHGPTRAISRKHASPRVIHGGHEPATRDCHSAFPRRHDSCKSQLRHTPRKCSCVQIAQSVGQWARQPPTDLEHFKSNFRWNVATTGADSDFKAWSHAGVTGSATGTADTRTRDSDCRGIGTAGPSSTAVPRPPARGCQCRHGHGASGPRAARRQWPYHGDGDGD